MLGTAKTLDKILLIYISLFKTVGIIILSYIVALWQTLRQIMALKRVGNLFLSECMLFRPSVSLCFQYIFILLPVL